MEHFALRDPSQSTIRYPDPEPLLRRQQRFEFVVSGSYHREIPFRSLYENGRDTKINDLRSTVTVRNQGIVALTRRSFVYY